MLDVLASRGLVATRIKVSGLEVQLGAVEVPRAVPELTKAQAQQQAEEAQRAFERLMYASAGGDS